MNRSNLTTKQIQLFTIAEGMKAYLSKFSDGERLDFFAELDNAYCLEYGCSQPKKGICQCWNDE